MKVFRGVVIAVVAAVILSSCGLFKKDCNCPHFGMKKLPAKVYRA
ncbi:MAG: hypothetical protein ABIR72_10645 [Mucilaginibacter sp.]